MLRAVQRFLDDTIDLVLDGLARLGLLRGGAAWWRQRLRRRLERFPVETENVRRSVTVRHRMCRECRALVPMGARTCTACGASMRHIPRGGLPRLLGFLAPSFGSVSSTLLGAIIVVYAIAALAGPGGASVWQIPAARLERLGMMRSDAILLGGEWWRLVTAVFLHGGLLHLLFNGMALASLGPTIEAAIGSRRLLVLFVATGALSFVPSLLIALQRRSVGASGAIFGLIGFGIVHARRRGGMFRRFGEDLTRWAVYGLLLSLMPGVDLAAHAGGFAVGALAALAVSGHAPPGTLRDRAWTLAAILAGALPPLCFGLALLR